MPPAHGTQPHDRAHRQRIAVAIHLRPLPFKRARCNQPDKSQHGQPHGGYLHADLPSDCLIHIRQQQTTGVNDLHGHGAMRGRRGNAGGVLFDYNASGFAIRRGRPPWITINASSC
jgi:hypothetical protein